MTVTEVNRAVGSWELSLRPSAPQELINALGYFGHIAITEGREDIRVSGDGIRRTARYVGVLRGITRAEDGTDLKGAGMASWLGDEEDKGAILETAVAISGATFANSIRALLPSDGSVVEGTLSTAPGSPYTGTHQYQTPRKAIDYVCDIFGAEWRVNGDATLDAGLPADLYNVTTPKAAIVRHGSGSDVNLRALDGSTTLAADVEDFTTRVVLLAQGEGESVATADADIAPGLNPYKDMRGNTVKRTRLIDESATDATNAEARAQLQLNRFTGQRTSLALSTETHDIRGDVVVGDAVWVYDPDSGIYDDATEVVFHGERMNPVKLRVTEMTWDVDQSMGVYYRTSEGVWWDLTDHVAFESGATRVTVGGYNRSLISSGNTSVGSRPVADSSIPGVPAFTLPFGTGIYQSPVTGLTRAQVELAWSQPLNTDLTAITDGALYEVRYRSTQPSVAQQTYNALATRTWDSLRTWDDPLGLAGEPWSQVVTGFDNNTLIIPELSPGLTYEFQIRAVDAATPPHSGAWSASAFAQMPGDTLKPSTPAAPIVAGNPIRVQVKHYLGKSSGGQFNLERDLDHLNIYAGATETFTPTADLLVGQLPANVALLSTGIVPAIGSFQLTSTDQVWVKVTAVDISGNESDPSTAAAATSELIESQNIRSITADQIDAGTINTGILIGGELATALSGARVSLNSTGLDSFNSGGINTVAINNDGTFELKSADSGARVNLSATGLRNYGSNGNLRTHLSSDGSFKLFGTDGTTATFVADATTGNLSILGQLATGTGARRIEIGKNSSDRSEIQLYSANSSSTHGYAALSVREFESESSIYLRSSATETSYPRAEIVLSPDWIKLCRQNAADPTDLGFHANGMLITESTIGISQTNADESVITAATFNGIESVLSRSSGGQVTCDAWAVRLRHVSGASNSFGVFYDCVAINAANPICGPGGPQTSARYSMDNQPRTAATMRLNWNGSNLQFVQADTGIVIKTFIIDHPVDKDRYLIHATTESPFNGVEYWGTAVVKDHKAEVRLPNYFEALTSLDDRQVQVSIVVPTEDMSVQATPDVEFVPEDRLAAWDESDELVPEAPRRLTGEKQGRSGRREKRKEIRPGQPYVPEHLLLSKVAASVPKSGKFRILTDAPDGTKVAWLVKAVRKDASVFVEPLKTEVKVQGNGPYKYYSLPDAVPGKKEK